MKLKKILMLSLFILMISTVVAVDKEINSYVNYTIDCYTDTSTEDETTRVTIEIIPREYDRKVIIFQKTLPRFFCEDEEKSISYRYYQDIDCNGDDIYECDYTTNISNILSKTNEILSSQNDMKSSNDICWEELSNKSSAYSVASSQLGEYKKLYDELKEETSDYNSQRTKANQYTVCSANLVEETDKRITYIIGGVLGGAVVVWFLMKQSKSAPSGPVSNTYPGLRGN